MMICVYVDRESRCWHHNLPEFGLRLAMSTYCQSGLDVFNARVISLVDPKTLAEMRDEYKYSSNASLVLMSHEEAITCDSLSKGLYIALEASCS